MLSSPNRKFVLFRSFLNFQGFFCKLKEQLLRVWENFVPTPENSTYKELDQNIGRNSLSQKGFPGDCPGGDAPSWN